MNHEDKNLSGCRASQKFSMYMYMDIYGFCYVCYISSYNQLKNYLFQKFVSF